MLATFNPALLILPVFAGLVGLLFWAASKQARKTRDQLQAWAEQAGLRLVEKTVLGFTTVESMEGEQQGRFIRYWSYTTGSGKSRTHWVAAGVRVPAGTTLQFELTRQGFGTKVMELFGVREIQVGDAAFDAAWFVRTNQPEYLAAALVPAIRTRLMGEISNRRGAGYKLDNEVVRYAENGPLTAAAVGRLAAQLPLLQDLADVAEVSARR